MHAPIRRMAIIKAVYVIISACNGGEIKNVCDNMSPDYDAEACLQQTRDQGYDCQGDQDCGSTRNAPNIGKPICIEYKCVLGCRSDRDCPAGRICAEEQDYGKYEQCKEGCRKDADCKSASICVKNACIDGCRDDNGCATLRGGSGFVYKCFQEECVQGCNDDEDCVNGICQLGEHGYKECILQACRSSPQCELFLTRDACPRAFAYSSACIDGVCQIPCTSTDDCPEIRNMAQEECSDKGYCRCYWAGGQGFWDDCWGYELTGYESGCR